MWFEPFRIAFCSLVEFQCARQVEKDTLPVLLFQREQHPETMQLHPGMEEQALLQPTVNVKAFPSLRSGKSPLPLAVAKPCGFGSSPEAQFP